MDDAHDPLGGMPTRRVKQFSSMSSRKIHILYGSIYTHLSSQGIWGARLGSVTLFGARKRSIMNRIESLINSLGNNKAEEDKRTGMLIMKTPERENGVGEGGEIKIRSALQRHPSSLT